MLRGHSPCEFTHDLYTGEDSGAIFLLLIVWLYLHSSLISLQGAARSLYKVSVEFYLYPTVGTVLIHSVKPELTE